MCGCNSSPGDQEFKASMSCAVKLYLDVGEGRQASFVNHRAADAPLDVIASSVSLPLT